MALKIKDKKGVFGLNAVQSFFAIILGIALLAYVIVVIMGTLNNSTVLPNGTNTVYVVNESSNVAPFVSANTSGYTLSGFNSSWSGIVFTAVYNHSDGTPIPVANVTVAQLTGVVTNGTNLEYNNVSLTYNYVHTYTTSAQANTQTILANTSTGITGFFTAINPVYSILAVLVIILVLVVLVRVVQAPSNSEAQL